jgi:hypothetical protein
MMYRAAIGAAIFVAGLAPLGAGAELLTAQIGGRTITYVVTAPQRGVGLSQDEILNIVRESKPFRLVVPDVPKGADSR